MYNVKNKMIPTRISLLIVNLNNLEYTKQCIQDLLCQDVKFNLTIIDQNSSEEGTSEYLDSFFDSHMRGEYYGKIDVLTIRNTGFNKPLNKIWNDFVEECDTEFVGLLNNDLRMSPNFLSSSIKVFDLEPIVGAINHATNNKEYSEFSEDLSYEIMDSPYRQGWDPIFRRICYHPIPDNLILYFGDDYIYSKLYQSGFKGAYVKNSPVIHFCSKTTLEKGRVDSGDSDRLNYSFLEGVYKNLSFNENLSKLYPEFDKIVEKKSSSIIDYFNEKKSNPSDINEHLETLKKYTAECETVVEMGVRWVVSTWAFMAGLPKKITSIDIVSPNSYNNHLDDVYKLSKLNGIDFQFKQEDTLSNNIEECDLLFIDTWHDYLQLKKELFRHHKKVKKYIILHDTVLFGFKNEPFYERLEENSGDDNLPKGLIPAINEFCYHNPEWYIHERFSNNNGLTILKKI
jgi:hypothetical protein